MRLPDEHDFTSRLRSAAVTARVGLWLGVCFGTAFVTGVVSHYAQLPHPPVPFPTSPSWGYRLTQGLHVTSGTAAVPLLLVKLWTVYPRLFARPPREGRELLLHALERGSIGLLVASSVFQLASGLANSAQWYPWTFSFRTTHYAVGWVAIGSLVLHIAVKLPVIRRALGADVEDTSQDRPTATEPGVLSRRGLLRTTWLATGVAVLATAGSTVPLLRRVSVLGVRSGDGPQGIPINKSARAARVTTTATSPSYLLTVSHGDTRRTFTRAELLALPQSTHELPIACVEGWSA
ncbi:MAG: molybdopterin-dependent oxidoreductase, partial [Mycobacteriales bacterium]